MREGRGSITKTQYPRHLHGISSVATNGGCTANAVQLIALRCTSHSTRPRQPFLCRDKVVGDSSNGVCVNVCVNMHVHMHMHVHVHVRVCAHAVLEQTRRLAVHPRIQTYLWYQQVYLTSLSCCAAGARAAAPPTLEAAQSPALSPSQRAGTHEQYSSKAARLNSREG